LPAATIGKGSKRQLIASAVGLGFQSNSDVLRQVHHMAAEKAG
jgi:hypothetical protein